MKAIINAAAAVAIAVSSFAALPSVASADSLDDLIAFQRIAPGAPNCMRNPDYPIIGRVSGTVTGYDTNSYFTHAGCFPNVASCERWLRDATDYLYPPHAFNSCEPRR